MQFTTGLRIDLGARWEKVDIKRPDELKQTVNLDDGSLARFANHHGKGQFAPGITASASLLDTRRELPVRRSSGLFRALDTDFPFAERQQLHDQPDCDRHHADDGISARSLTSTPTALSSSMHGVLHQVRQRRFQQLTCSTSTRVHRTQQQGFAAPRLTASSSKAASIRSTVRSELQCNLAEPGIQVADLYHVGQQPAGAARLHRNQLIRVPKNQLRIVPGFQSVGRQVALQFSAEYEGKRYVDTANSVVLPRTRPITRARATTSRSHFAVAYADNITNSLGLTEGNPARASLQSSDAGAKHLPRSTIARALLSSFLHDKF